MYRCMFYSDFNDKNPIEINISENYDFILRFCKKACKEFASYPEKIDNGFKAPYDDRHWIVGKA